MKTLQLGVKTLQFFDILFGDNFSIQNSKINLTNSM